MRRAVATGAAGAAAKDRLWRTLAKPHERETPIQGADVLGAWASKRWTASLSVDELRSEAEAICESSEALRSHSDGALRVLAGETRDRYVLERGGEDSTTAGFALSREWVRRILGLDLYVEQVMGGLVMARGGIAEMATGEGKTLTAIAPTAMLAWRGLGVHVVTVNDYLAGRDAEITRPVYEKLGLTVGTVVDTDDPKARRRAYACSVTYSAEKQVIFDWLRDRLISPVAPRLTEHLLDQLTGGAADRDDPRVDPKWGERVVHRGLHAVLIDEIDSVLIDEAVTPAIVSLPDSSLESDQERFAIACRLSGAMRERDHFTVDRPLRHVALTDEGRAFIEERSGEFPEFWRGPRRREELIKNAITAEYLFTKGDDYVVMDGELEIVDRSTGRVLRGRQWQFGMHQAVQAKEGVDLSEVRSSSARTAYQSFFRRYEHLCGMSGTVLEVEDELWRVYGAKVTRVPTHRPVARERLEARVFTDEQRKLEAVVARIAEVHAEGQPVLAGTRSVLTSERLGAMLGERGIRCRILNAEREAEEAEIVAEAGRHGAVTVATNMAGRGTDIKLDETARAAGGLYVILTEKHDDARIDRQLEGRSGRQGDPGTSEAFVSLEDQLIQLHGLKPLKWLMGRVPEGLRGVLSRVLWWQAQHSAASRSRQTRAAAARMDAFRDMAMPVSTR